MGQLIYQQEFLLRVQEELEVLTAAEHAETEARPDLRPYAPNWPLYRAAEEAGILRIFTARTPGGRDLVGYVTVFCNADPHSTGTTTCSTDVIYFAPAHRQGFAFPRMLRFVEQCLAEDGMKSLNVISRTALPLDKLLVRSGYTLTHVVHEKVF
jgi:hypothetical protein